MSCSYVDLFIARQKMRIKNTNACLSFITTLWKGEVIMLCFNNLNKKIISTFCNQFIDEKDSYELEILVSEFMFLSCSRYFNLTKPI
jgi:hypothetical protein